MLITLPVSVGEAIDKLTILDIKLQKISDGRKADVEKEQRLLESQLKDFVVKYPFHYKILKEINLHIWELQDELRDSRNLTSKEYHEMCTLIISENDRRFRVKSKINRLSDSDLKEQKGYIKRSVYIMPHLGYGDMINTIGAIRYYSTVYEEVIVGCMEEKIEQLKLFFRDDPEIILEHPLYGNTPEVYGNFEEIKRARKVDQVYVCGVHNSKRTPITNTNMPDCFYLDMKLDPKIRSQYFYFPETESSLVLYNKLKETGKKYIFVHEKSSNGVVNLQHLVEQFPRHLVICCNRNMYGSKNSFLDEFVDKPIIDYCDIIRNADEIYLIDSALLCLANHLDLSKVNKKYIYTRYGRQYPTYLQKDFIVK